MLLLRTIAAAQLLLLRATAVAQLLLLHHVLHQLQHLVLPQLLAADAMLLLPVVADADLTLAAVSVDF